MSHRRPYRPHTYSYGNRHLAQRRREGFWQRIKQVIHEHSPRIDLGNWP